MEIRVFSFGGGAWIVGETCKLQGEWFYLEGRGDMTANHDQLCQLQMKLVLHCLVLTRLDVGGVVIDVDGHG